MLQTDRKNLLTLGALCLVLAVALVCMAFAPGGRSLFSIDAGQVARVEYGYRLVDSGEPVYYVFDDRETVDTLVEYVNRYQYQSVISPDPVLQRSGAHMPEITFLDASGETLGHGFVRPDGITVNNTFYYCTNSYFAPLYDFVLEG